MGNRLQEKLSANIWQNVVEHWTCWRRFYAFTGRQVVIVCCDLMKCNMLYNKNSIIWIFMLCPPGGPLLRYVLTCVYGNSQKRVPFSEWGSDLSRSEIRVSFWAEVGNKGTFLVTLFVAWHYLGMFGSKCYPCSSHWKIYMMPFRDKGIILLVILVIYTMHKY